jgi:microcystin-dependent protein
MVESVTKNYGWVKPELQKSPSTWGGFLNTDLDNIDALVFANQQGIAPVGQGALWFTNTPPANWLLCNGASLSTTTYAGLFAVFGYTYGGSGANFNLPNLQGKFPLGVTSPAAPGAAGGAFTAPIGVANLPPHAHPITDVAHSHTAQQNAHAHNVATGSHAHSVSTGAHSHGGVLVSSGVTGGAPAGIGFVGNVGNTAGVGDLGGSTSTVGNLGGNTDTQQPAVGVNASGTGLSTTQSTGSGTPLPVVPPYLTINFIVRYQ